MEKGFNYKKKWEGRVKEKEFERKTYLKCHWKPEEAVLELEQPWEWCWDWGWDGEEKRGTAITEESEWVSEREECKMVWVRDRVCVSEWDQMRIKGQKERKMVKLCNV